MFTKPQVVLTGFCKLSVTSAARGSALIEQNQRRETARDLNAFLAIVRGFRGFDGLFSISG